MSDAAADQGPGQTARDRREHADPLRPGHDEPADRPDDESDDRGAEQPPQRDADERQDHEDHDQGDEGKQDHAISVSRPTGHNTPVQTDESPTSTPFTAL